MHELSIAESILDAARRHMPAGAVLRSVCVRVGPMRGVDPDSMDLAWQACTDGTDAGGAKLRIEFLPWRLSCPACHNTFAAAAIDAVCSCGSPQAHPVGGDELILDSLEVDDPAEARAAI